MTRTRAITVTGAVLLAISPVTISSDGRIVPAQACADGTCCPEARSICFINGIRTNDAFYNGSGPCVRES